MSNCDTQVLIAGGGPVGMTLALELAHHGIRSIIAERNPSTTVHPKMDLTNGRSMELYRRLGIVEDLRKVGVAPTEPLDIVWATKATGHVLHRFAYHSPDGYRDAARVCNDGTRTIEPGMRVSQVVLEPVLKAKIDANPLVDVRFGWAFESLEQDDEGVTSVLRNSASKESRTVRSVFLAGCDGGGSKVREGVGIGLIGEFAIASAFMVHFRSTAYDVLAKFGIAYHLQSEQGTIIAQNGKDIWTLQTIASKESDPNQLLRDFVGCDFDYEILVANPWTPHVVVAENYRAGRVFLAGDSGHQFIPTGGYGMNTGVGDAVDLGWKLAGALNGWGGPALLDSYDAERRKIGAQNRDAALDNARIRFAIGEAMTKAKAEGDLDTPEAAERRIALGAVIEGLTNIENERWGIEYGFRYLESPVIAYDDPAPAFDHAVFEVTTSPGGRLPHFFLADGRPLFDLLGNEFTLLAIGGTDIGDFEARAAAAKMPVKVVRLEREPILDRLERRLILVRTDQHVAWRSNQTPADWQTIIKIVTGNAA